MLTIYTVPVATYCAKLRVMMRHKSIAWEELSPPGGYGSAEYKAIVPSGNLPAMIHDGFMLSDSEATAEYLNEAFAQTPMLPDTVQLRAKAREKGVSMIHVWSLQIHVWSLQYVPSMPKWRTGPATQKPSRLAVLQFQNILMHWRF